ncbi:MAG TPA: addiction module protein [Gammaproteobacteria bacterium]|jgi:hypothetical protein|uniref:Addiction module protein n=1 Tax=uncultured gamma proteobacterium Rifle_16ft_4_minimus_1061 TaxID=1665198 RepID=A0A0H4T019_9GAMM|nr:hypothetical protein [uncultured gamma proteobacterium Rifle_16ft_4_minimus_1061]HLF09831.1 addiction module protein [Gammaproteobacteria bacterium]
MDREMLEQEALGLPPAERAKLAHALLASFDGFPPAGIDEQWLEEAERRFKELDGEAVREG